MTTETPAATASATGGAADTETTASTTAAEATDPNVGNLMAEAQASAPGAADATTADTAAETDEKDKAEDTSEGAPESYADFTLPEDVALRDETLSAFKDFAKAQNLSQEQAQRFLTFGTEQLKEAVQAPYRLWAETQRSWQAEVAQDPETGGAWGTKQAPGPAQIAATKAIDRFGGQALRTALNVTGAGNNPAIVKAFVQMGKLLSEPGFATGGKPSEGPKPAAEVLYPDMARS